MRLEPSDAAELSAIVADHARRKQPIAVSGAGTRSGLGRPVQAAAELSTARLSGITLYEPAELVIAARAGTPLSTVTDTLAGRGQRLAFEPMDHRRLYRTSGEPTIGGVAAANVSGSARINLGAARDAMIGVKFINGRGEDITSGGRVMKNVTGLDLVKALAGSHGTLGVLHEVCFKVMPRAEREATLVIEGLSDVRAVEALSAALGSPFEPTGAAHVTASGGAQARTLIRIEGFEASVLYRRDALARLLKPFGSVEMIGETDTEALWRSIRDGGEIATGESAVWRLSVRPTLAARAGAALSDRGASLLYDWGGGLIWTSMARIDNADAAFVHETARVAGGYATLVRAPNPVRLAVDVFSPPAPGLMALQRKLKASLDPDGILNPGRMYQGL